LRARTQAGERLGVVIHVRAGEAQSEPEQWAKAFGEAGTAANVPDREQDSRHEGRSVERVVSNGQALAHVPEQNLLVGDQAREPQ
jgi:hypothetical protein